MSAAWDKSEKGIMLNDTAKQKEAEQDGAKDEVEHGPIKQKAEDFADKTSLHGVNFIRKAESKPALIFFVCVFLICLGMTINQVTRVFIKYFEYPVDTKVTLSHEHLAFPAVTICNVNPFRRSKLYLDGTMALVMHGTDEAAKENLQYSDIAELLREANKELPNDLLETLGGTTDTQDDEAWKNVNMSDPKFWESVTRIKNQFGDEDFWSDIDADDDTSERKISNETIARRVFLALVSLISKEIRLQMGHQLNETILSCTFNGFQCDHRDFKVLLDGDYGNCFQFNSDKIRRRSFISRKPGPLSGLILRLYSQHHEYVKGLTGKSGFRVAIHPFNTLAFPADSGISVSTGAATDIGMKLVNISRLGGKYGDCVDNTGYEQKYGVQYSTALCHAAHLEDEIAKKCRCMRSALYSYYPLGTNLPSCSDDRRHLRCVQDQVVASFSSTHMCYPACSDMTYEFIISQYHYPEHAQWGELVKQVCRVDNFGEGCLKFLKVQVKPNATKLETYVTSNNQVRKLRSNFAVLRAYYEDLNYENIQQEPSYDEIHLGGDIGGSLGLYFGMSVFTGVEVLTLFLSIFIACTRVVLKK